MKLSCPKCRTRTKGRLGFFKGLAVLIFFPLGLVLLLTSRLYRCPRCGYTWKS